MTKEHEFSIGKGAVAGDYKLGIKLILETKGFQDAINTYMSVLDRLDKLDNKNEYRLPEISDLGKAVVLGNDSFLFDRSSGKGLLLNGDFELDDEGFEHIKSAYAYLGASDDVLRNCYELRRNWDGIFGVPSIDELVRFIDGLAFEKMISEMPKPNDPTMKAMQELEHQDNLKRIFADGQARLWNKGLNL